MILAPDYLSTAFQQAAAGYLSTPSHGLPAVLRSLPMPTSMREHAIAEAIRDGVRDPVRWERNRAYIKLRNKPERGSDGVLSVRCGLLNEKV